MTTRELPPRLELECLKALWTLGEANVRDVQSALDRPLAYTTVMTVLARLAVKGALVRHQQGRSFAYAPKVADEAALAVRDVVRDYGEAALAHFVDEARADPKLYRRLRRLMGEDQ